MQYVINNNNNNNNNNFCGYSHNLPIHLQNGKIKLTNLPRSTLKYVLCSHV